MHQSFGALLFGGICLPLQTLLIDQKCIISFEKDCIIIRSPVGGKRNLCRPAEVYGSGETTAALGARDGNGTAHK
jgi:hypothetical protein